VRGGQSDSAPPRTSTDEFGQMSASLSSLFHRRAYEAVQAVVSDDNNYERGVAYTCAVVDAVLAEAGACGCREPGHVMRQ
jgi:hypothetical protein